MFNLGRVLIGRLTSLILKTYSNIFCPILLPYLHLCNPVFNRDSYCWPVLYHLFTLTVPFWLYKHLTPQRLPSLWKSSYEYFILRKLVTLCCTPNCVNVMGIWSWKISESYLFPPQVLSFTNVRSQLCITPNQCGIRHNCIK